jgi:hypothetical protein
VISFKTSDCGSASMVSKCKGVGMRSCNVCIAKSASCLSFSMIDFV